MTETTTHGLLEAGEHVTFSTNSGRTIHLWLHECETCVSLDVWTDRGREVEPISESTGDETRAPLGVFTIVRGASHRLDTGLEPVHGSARRSPTSTAMLVWDDNETESK